MPKAVPGLMPAYTTPPTIGAKHALTHQGAILPVNASKTSMPTTGSVAKWAEQLTGRPERIEQCREILTRLDDRDLETWSYTRREIEEQLSAVDPDGARPRGPKWSRHVLERKLLLAARRRVGDNLLGRNVRRLREVCDLLLR